MLPVGRVAGSFGNMNRARILVVILAIGGIVGALVLFLTRARDAAKPLTYRDRTIEDWFAQMPVTPLPPPGVDLGNVRGFIKSTGQQYGSTNLFDDAKERCSNTEN